MKTLPAFCLIVLLGFSSCNWGNDDDCDPNMTCDTNIPTTGELTVKLTINPENPSVPVTIYLGQFEANVPIYFDTLTAESELYIVPVDDFYTVTAEYKDGNKTILAIDGDHVGYSSDENCGYTCYTVQNGSVDLRLAK